MTKVTKRSFHPGIRSRHPSHNILRLRGNLERMPFRSVIRFGSTTEVHGVDVEVNTTKAIRNSASKLLMKQCFQRGEVKTAAWTAATNEQHVLTFSSDKYPVVTKSLYGSRGRGNTLIKSSTQMENWLKGKDLSNYIVEKFHNYNREYRLHVTEEGCFYTCRKMIKSDTPEDQRWFRNDSNCVWVMEENPQFDKPSNWDDIVSECVKALKSCGLDFGACDVRVQSAKDQDQKVRKNPDFIIVEINSAPSFGEVTARKYMEELPKILKSKYQKQNSK